MLSTTTTTTTISAATTSISAEHHSRTTLLEVIRFTRMPLIITSIGGNLAVIIVLLRYKVLRKNSSNLLIAQLGLADFIVGLGIFIRAVQNELSIFNANHVFNRAQCMLFGATSIFGILFLQSTIIMIAIDRVTALARPILYRRYAESKCLSLNRLIICLLTSMLVFGVQFIGFPDNKHIALCSSGATWTTGYRLFFLIFTGSAAILTIVLNAITVVVYRAHHFYSSHRKENSALVITQTAIMISYTIFWCIPTILYLICYVLGFEASIFGSITMILSTGSGFFACITPFLFLWKHNEFRTFFVRFYHLQGLFKQTSVSNLGTVSLNERKAAKMLRTTHIMNVKVSAVTAIEFAK